MPAGDGCVLEAEEAGGGDRPEHVLDVEAAAQARRDVESVRAEPCARRGQLERLGSDIGVVGEAEGHERAAVRAHLVGQAAAPRAA